MNKGFFIVIVKAQSVRIATGMPRKNFLRADLLHPIKGWAKTTGETLQLVAEGQRNQYDTWLATDKAVPDLVDEDCGPMATGQTVRFVAVN